MDRLLDVNQVAELLNVKPATIYGWVHDGLIPHYKIHRLVRFDEGEVVRWLKGKHRHTRRNPVDISIS